MMKINSTLAFLLAVMSLPAAAQDVRAQMNFVDFSTWVTGTSNQTLNFPGHGTVSVSGMTNSFPGWPTYYSETYNNISAPITGTVPELLVSANTGQTATIRFDFSSPLTSSSYMIIDDIDGPESMSFMAYDSSNNLLNLSSWTFSKYDIKPPNNSIGPAFSLVGTTQGVLNSDGAITTQWAAFFQPAAGQNVARIDATFTNGAFFEFAFASPVPEPSSALLLGLTGAAVFMRRRRPARA